MPVFLLDHTINFPPVNKAEEGLLAVGGDLSPERIIEAYRNGIFPWYSEEDPILWWSPARRMILYPEKIHISKRLQRIIHSGYFEVRSDRDFEGVIRGCAGMDGKHEDGTWILPDMIEAYCHIHELGFAHSFECYHEGALVGGLYGISLGRAFFGESMFSLVSNASKVALAALALHCQQWSFELIDCQMHTPHLESMGAVELSRKRYMALLQKSLQFPTRQGKWILGRE